MTSLRGQVTPRSRDVGEASSGFSRVRSELQSTITDVVQRAIEAALNEQKVVGARRIEPGPPSTAEGAAVQVRIWEDDPLLEAVGSGPVVPAGPIEVDLPVNSQPLQTQIQGPAPAPGLYSPSTLDFLYWNAASALARGINFWNPLLPPDTQWSADQQPLQVQLDKGVDFNAFYARESGLNFFHGLVRHAHPRETVFSGESPHVVCHELGHAILDALKPELFDAMSLEVAAFHESFGDMSSIVSALQLPSLRQFVLEETGGRLSSNSRLSQLARQLGWAIRLEIGPTAVDNDCLRNACNSFFYHNPASLPPDAPTSQLSSEPHSFSRVFTGVFLDVLARMYQVGPATGQASDSENLQAISIDAGRLLVEGVRLASVGPGFYAQVAAGMIQADHTLNGGRYRAALTSSFVQRGILSPATAVSVSKDLQTHGAQVFGVTGVMAGMRQLRFAGDNEGYKKTGKDVPVLPICPLTTSFGLTLHVHMPGQASRFFATAALATGGSERFASPEEDARSYLEDLVQRDQVSPDSALGKMPPELMSPGESAPSDKTHRLVLDEGRTVVKRHHFACGCKCRNAAS